MMFSCIFHYANVCVKVHEKRLFEAHLSIHHAGLKEIGREGVVRDLFTQLNFSVRLVYSEHVISQGKYGIHMVSLFTRQTSVHVITLSL